MFNVARRLACGDAAAGLCIAQAANMLLRSSTPAQPACSSATCRKACLAHLPTALPCANISACFVLTCFAPVCLVFCVQAQKEVVVPPEVANYNVRA